MQRDIRCPECNTLFGKEISTEDAEGNSKASEAILTIKNRDLYRSYKGGLVWGPCRNCGVTVAWPRE